MMPKFIDTVPYIICIITGIVCLFTASTLTIYSSSDSNRHELSQALRQNRFRDFLICSISISFPMMIHLILDNISAPYITTRYFVTRWISILAFVIPNIILLTVVCKVGEMFLYWILIYMQALLLFSTSFSHLMHNGNPVWGSSKCVIMIGCLGLFFTFNINDEYVLYFGSVFGVLAFFFYLMSLTLFLTTSYFWYKKHLRKRSINQLSPGEFFCFFYMSSLMVVYLGIFLILIFFRNSLKSDFSEIYISTYTCAVTGCVLFISVIHGRNARFEIIKAQNSLEVKRMFVRYISHEIRTPLNTIFLGLKHLKEELLHNQIELSKIMDVLDEIQCSSDNALNILNDLLTYEKIESGVLQFNLKKIMMWNFIYSTVKPCISQAFQVGVEILIDDHNNNILGQATVTADEQKLAQVIKILVSNAVKASPRHGTVTVRGKLVSSVCGHSIANSTTSKYSVEETGKWKKFFRVEVTDSGTSISKEKQENIFHQIESFSPDILQDGQGIGLGLWISKEIVDALGGRIGVYSNHQTAGTTFFFEIPIIPSSLLLLPLIKPSFIEGIAEDEEDDDDSNCFVMKRLRTEYELKNTEIKRSSFIFYDNNSAKDYSNTEFSPVSYQKVELDRNHLMAKDSKIHPMLTGNTSSYTTTCSFSVLIVDDAITNRKMLGRLLSARKYIIHEATDGIEAVDKVKQSIEQSSLFDVILMDYVMPNMDGPTASAKIRSLGYRGIIIGATGNALPQDVQKFLSNGADKVLIKPICIDILEAVINDLILNKSEHLCKQRDYDELSTHLLQINTKKFSFEVQRKISGSDTCVPNHHSLSSSTHSEGGGGGGSGDGRICQRRKFNMNMNATIESIACDPIMLEPQLGREEAEDSRLGE